MFRVGIVAGEPSGDYLGAELIRDLISIRPDTIVTGVGGEKLEAAGCSIIAPMERLSVIGLAEVIGRYPELLAMRARIIGHFLDDPPDIFIGIDVPDFNLGLENKLRRHGIKTAHYVSPSVWAWRRNRIGKIRKAVDLMLTLFPFEHEFYREQGINSVYAGHPMLRRSPAVPDREQARARLGLDPGATIIAVLPGSRHNELDRLAMHFSGAAGVVKRQLGELQVISNMVNTAAAERLKTLLEKSGPDMTPVNVYINEMPDVLQAANAALAASGTVTLEAMIYNCPMAVAYRINPLTYRIIRSMAYIEHVALPNILAGREVVPELLQGECNAGNLGNKIYQLLTDDVMRGRMLADFESLRNSLSTPGNMTAAKAILDLVA